MSTIAPAHYLNLSASVLKTDAFALAQRAVSDCVGLGAMGTLYGHAGHGKTFAVRAALATVTDRPIIAVDCQTSMTYKGLVEMLLDAVTSGIPHRGTRAQLERALLRELRSEHRVICIDEAQRLNAEGIEILRSLHDDVDTKFALLLVGGNGCWDVLSSQPMLRSRIHRVVEFKQLTEPTVIKLMPRFHAVLRECDPALFRFVDRSFARGSLRNWASFAHTAEAICSQLGEVSLTEPIARNAFTLLGARPVRVSSP